MVLNRVVRRQGIKKADLFASVTADFKDLFSNFKNVVVSEAAENTKIYLNGKTSNYLQISKSANEGVEIHLKTADIDGKSRDSVRVDGGNKTDETPYSFIKTKYGAAFTPMPYNTNRNTTVADSSLQIFFTTFQDEDGKDVNGFVYVPTAADHDGGNQFYILTEKHTLIEKHSIGSLCLGTSAGQTVLGNVFSYSKILMAPHLYKKLESESGLYGKIKLGGKNFISGSHFCLEMGE